MFHNTDYSTPDNYANIFNILTATVGESSNYIPKFKIYGNLIRTPLLNNIKTVEELNEVALQFSNEYLPVWTLYNKEKLYFPVIFYKVPGLDYPLNTSKEVSYLNTGFLGEYLYKITSDKNVKLIVNYKEYQLNNLSIYDEEINDTWLTYGGNDLNTGYMPTNIIRPSNALAMAVQKVSSTLPIIDKQTYHPVFDTTHIFALIAGLDSTSPTGFCINGTGILVKINKSSGILELSISSAEIFKSVTTDISRIVTRSPPELTDKYIYLSTSGNNSKNNQITAIAKLNKFDLSVIWIKETIVNSIWQTGRNIKAITPNSKYVSENLKDKTIIIQAFAVTGQYGSDIFSYGYKYNYDYNWWTSQGGCLAIVDNGTYAETLWNFIGGPKMLKQGDTIPFESFVEGNTTMIINYPLVYINHKGVLYDSTNYTDNITNVKGFKINDSTSGIVNFDYLNYDMTKILSTYSFTLTSGMILLNNDTKYFSNDGNPEHFVTGTQIFQGQNITKVVKVGEIINNPFDAMNLNYYGSGCWGTISYDDVTGTLYIPTSQGHKQPLNDGELIKSQTNINELAYNYQETVNKFYMDPPQASALDVQNAYNEYDKSILKAKEIKRSPRWNRFFIDGLVALNPNNGNIKWYDSPYSYDAFYWLQTIQPKFNDYSKVGTNSDNVSGATIVTLQDGKTRRIFTSDKGAHVSYYDANDDNYYIIGNNINNYENGIVKMVPPTPTYISVGIAGFQGGSVFGSCSDGNVYITHQTNIPIGSILLVDKNGSSSENIKILNNSNIGYITDKVVPNDQSEVTDFEGNQKLIHSLNGYLIAIDCTTGLKKWVCPLSSTLDVLTNSTNLFTGVPAISDNGPVRLFGNVAVVGLASGKVHFVDSQTGEMLKTMSFVEGAAMGVVGSSDSLYLLSGWNKWYNANQKYTSLPVSKHLYYLTVNGV